MNNKTMQALSNLLPLRRRRRGLRASVVAAVIALIFLGGCASKSDEDTNPTPPANAAHDVSMTAAQRKNITLYTVATSRFHKTVETSGAVDFDNDQSTSVLAPFSGPVSRVLVSLGDRVKKGQPLALVDSPDFAAAVSAYSKALATAKTNRRLADADKDLSEHEGVAERENAQAQTDAANADADRDAALQALVALDVDPQAIRSIQQGHMPTHIQGIIRAPLAGTVVEKLVTPGQLLAAGTTACFTVADLSRVWVMAQVSGSDLATVHVGDTADIITGIAATNLTGTVDNISALVNPDTRSVIARVVVTNPGDVLKKQMYVTVRIHSQQESSGLLIPVSAMLRDDENLPFVYIASQDGSFARRSITMGERIGNKFDVPDGLHAGDQVVVDGGIFVQFMQNQ
jgi:cobalt-zinc-cadmium efflux system membrane fusion protein